MSNMQVGGGGFLARSGRPSEDAHTVAFSGDLEVMSHAVGFRPGSVGLALTVEKGFFARLGAAWRLFWSGLVVFRAHPLIALDVSRRLMPAAAKASMGDQGMGGSDIDMGLAIDSSEPSKEELTP